jgi:hypothetical protein
MKLPPVLAPVAVLVDVPEHGLTRGKTRTVVEHPGDDGAVLVEFSDENGETYAAIDLLCEQVIARHRRLYAA